MLVVTAYERNDMHARRHAVSTSRLAYNLRKLAATNGRYLRFRVIFLELSEEVELVLHKFLDPNR